MLRNIWAVAWNAYARKDLPMVLLLFVFPIALCTMMVSMFSAEAPYNLPVGIVAEGGGELQGRILRAIETTKAATITVRCKDISECSSAMRSGEILAFVYVPHDLEEKAIRYETPAVTVYTNGQSLLTSKVITNDIRMAVATQGAVLVQNTIQNPIGVEVHIVGNPTGNYEHFLGIGLVIALFHVIAMLFGAYFFAFPIREREVGTWLSAAGNSMVAAYLGRLLPAVFVLGTEMMSVLLLVRMGMPALEPIDRVVLFGGGYLMVATCMALGASFVGIVGEMRVALSAAAVVGGPAFAFCGQTFPVFAMPFVIRCWTFILPITQMMKLQSAFFFGHLGIERAFWSFEVLAVFFVFWSLVAMLTLGIRLPRALRKEEAELCSA
ncbi:ABC transporter permease [Hallerella succinigenes]|uniref:ABC transporter permease n=1 Tax=Hallerella succinigenes TaxID=1896222 RepID=UPI002A7F117C|nr:ABC transporter permease [Hallerella succinigenes]MDY5028755.1 ABC transporter permease [Hallerella succinigenes]